MKITTKGQVTIPQHIREELGLLPNTDVDGSCGTVKQSCRRLAEERCAAAVRWWSTCAGVERSR